MYGTIIGGIKGDTRSLDDNKPFQTLRFSFEGHGLETSKLLLLKRAGQLADAVEHSHPKP